MTLQTLHPSKFDGGDIIAQTPYPGVKHGTTTVEGLRSLLAPIGAQMLVQAIKDRSFFPPVRVLDRYRDYRNSTEITYASKIGPDDRHIVWDTWTASDILKRQQIIGPLWNTTVVSEKGRNGESKEAKRIIWDQGFRLLEEECHILPAIGHPIIVGLHGPTQNVYIRTCDGRILVANTAKVEGQSTTEAVSAARRHSLAPIPTRLEEMRQAPNDFVPFYSRLG